jgi:isopentenyl-diphosphate Delta-isomerase
MTTGASLNQVILVDSDDRPVGLADKMAAHRTGLLHRAFSLIVQRDDGQVLLQRRAVEKYHSGGLWTNTCCSHPRPGESVVEAARRRLFEEMGMASRPQSVGRFTYRAALDDDLVEHEIDHVLVAPWDGHDPRPDPAEVADWRWLSVARLRYELRQRPRWFTVWLAPALDIWQASAASYVPTHRSTRAVLSIQ